MEIIRGKKALVTGAASGIGRAIALALAREGADLFLVDIDEPHLRISARAAEALGSKVLIEVCDLSKPTQISACTVACLRAFGTLDILVNCAGIIHYGHADEMTAEKWNAVMSVNLFAPIQLARELLPALTAQKESHILNVCSVLGLVPVRKLMGYQTSKFALVGFSLALRTEYCAQNVGVTALCPGFVDTPMLERFGPAWFKKLLRLGPLSLVVTADVVARQAVASIRNNRGIAVVSFGGKIIWLFIDCLRRWFFGCFAGRLDQERSNNEPQAAAAHVPGVALRTETGSRVGDLSLQAKRRALPVLLYGGRNGRRSGVGPGTDI